MLLRYCINLDTSVFPSISFFLQIFTKHTCDSGLINEVAVSFNASMFFCFIQLDKQNILITLPGVASIFVVRFILNLTAKHALSCVALIVLPVISWLLGSGVNFGKLHLRQLISSKLVCSWRDCLKVALTLLPTIKHIRGSSKTCLQYYSKLFVSGRNFI